jgi:four helix bundle protein
MHDHQQLRVWAENRDLVSRIYHLTRNFPHDERFGLTAQLRRTANSIPSNIAEGAGRRGTGRSFGQFLRIAAGSASEAETQLQLALDLGFVGAETVEPHFCQVRSIRKMLWGLESHYSRQE